MSHLSQYKDSYSLRRVRLVLSTGSGRLEAVVWIIAMVAALALVTLLVVAPSGVTSHVRGLLFVVTGALVFTLVVLRQWRHRHGKND
jgi:membrane protein YdbS with pleckstrin-like domain